MELDHEFRVPVPVDQAWAALLDLERVAPCVPGATLDTVDGEEFTGRLKVKVGAMTITYKGGARIAVADEAAHSVTIEGTAKEARGSGTAAATVQAQLHDEGEATRVTVHTKLNVTGRPAQFGRGLLSEVGGKLISRFATALAEELEHPAAAQAAPPETAETADTTETAEAEAPRQTPEAVVEAPAPVRHEDEAVDLLEVAGPSLVKRIVPVVAGLLAVLTVRQLFRRRRGRHHR